MSDVSTNPPAAAPAASNAAPPRRWFHAVEQTQRIRGRHHAFRTAPIRPDSRRYPDFYIVGPHKTGTTWLIVQLRMHPQIWSPLVKEIFYFDEYWSGTFEPWMHESRRQGFEANLVPEDLAVVQHNYVWSDEHIQTIREHLSEHRVVDDEWYAKFFEPCGVDQLCFDASATAVTLPAGARAHMRRLSPHGRAIIILRDPVDRIWSYLRMMLKATGGGPDQIDALLRDQGRFLVQSSNYARIVENYIWTFGRENVLVLSYDQLSSDPLALLRSVCSFLAIDYHPDIFYNAKSVIFEGPAQTMQPSTRAAILNVIKDLVPTYRPAFGEMAAGWQLE